MIFYLIRAYLRCSVWAIVTLYFVVTRDARWYDGENTIVRWYDGDISSLDISNIFFIYLYRITL